MVAEYEVAVLKGAVQQSFICLHTGTIQPSYSFIFVGDVAFDDSRAVLALISKVKGLSTDDCIHSTDHALYLFMSGIRGCAGGCGGHE